MPGECRGNSPDRRGTTSRIVPPFPPVLFYFQNSPRYFPPFPPRPGHHAGNREQKTGTLYPVSDCSHIPRVPFPTFPAWKPAITPWSLRSGCSVFRGANLAPRRTLNEIDAPDTLKAFEPDSIPRCKVQHSRLHHTHRPILPPCRPTHHRPTPSLTTDNYSYVS